MEPFLADLREAVDAARQLPSGGMRAIAAQLTEQARGGGLTPEHLGMLMAGAGVEDAELPARLAPIHELLDALPRPLVEQVLCAFFDRMLVPSE